MKTYKVKNVETGEVTEWTLEEVLSEINRDTSDNWTDYNETDWREGWDEWVERDGYYTMNLK